MGLQTQAPCGLLPGDPSPQPPGAAGPLTAGPLAALVAGPGGHVPMNVHKRSAKLDKIGECSTHRSIAFLQVRCGVNERRPV